MTPELRVYARGVETDDQVIIDGVTEDGLSVRVTEASGDPPQCFAVFVDGERVRIIKADRLRDGGTTIIETVRGTFEDTRPRMFSTSGTRRSTGTRYIH